MKVSIQREDFDLTVEVDSIRKNNPKIGAVASFIGQVRDVSMTLEHYPGMTENSIKKIIQEAQERWQVMDCTVIHRYGRIQPGEDIMMVVTVSSHRAAAFEAADFLMDYLKTRAPFWKQVEKADGKIWVNAKAADDEAAGRWTSTGKHQAAE